MRLLDAEPDLGMWLHRGEFEHARAQATFPIVELSEAEWHTSSLARHPGVRGRVHGFLLVSGTLALQVRVADRICTRVIAQGDLVLLDGIEGDTFPASWAWSALGRARLAVLDERLLVCGRLWPGLMSAILAKGAAQARHAQLQHAVSQLPRVEDRLILLFWTLADRIGTTRPDGVWVPLSLTQKTLGRMIGARRPTVSLALRNLAEENLITRRQDGWLIDRRSLDRVADPPEALSEASRASR